VAALGGIEAFSRILPALRPPVPPILEYRTALALYRKLADDNPRIPRYRNGAANLENNLSVVHRRLGRPAEARDQGEFAVAHRETLVKQDPRTTG
jgi:hypothetical protein